MSLTELEKVREAAAFIRNRCNIVAAPQLGIVCGSGLGKLADLLDAPRTVRYAEIPHFVQSTVVGHSGELVFGEKEGVQLVCMRGRVHMYEGYSVLECVRPVRVLATLGVRVLLVTNAAGNINKDFAPGDFVVLRDHISMPSISGANPLRGPHDPAFGERFVIMSNVYDRQLISVLESVAAGLQPRLDCTLRKGVYTMVSGPTYETVAEARMMRLLGADTVGMSTAHEVTAAHQMGVRCMGISLITNNVKTDYDEPDGGEEVAEHEQIVEMANKRSHDFVRLIVAFLAAIKPTLAAGAPRGLQNDCNNKHNATPKHQTASNAGQTLKAAEANGAAPVKVNGFAGKSPQDSAPV